MKKAQATSISIEEFVKVQAKTLAFIAWADGSLDASEEKYWSNYLKQLNLNASREKQLNKLFRQRPNKKSLLSSFKKLPPYIGIGLIKNAYLMSQANGIFDKKESRSISELAHAMGIKTKSQINRLFRSLNLYFLSHQETERLIAGISEHQT